MFFMNAAIRRSTQAVTGLNREAPPVAGTASGLWRSRRPGANESEATGR